MLRLQPLLLGLLVLLSACATLPGPASSRSARGLIVLTAADASVALDEQGVIRTLAGPSQLLDQLARIPGAIVSIQGSATAKALRVRDFEIIDAGDGLRPLVGWLIVDQGGVQLEDSVTGTRLALRGEALAKLKEHHGARVWVTGSVNGPQMLLIAHWGILVPR